MFSKWFKNKKKYKNYDFKKNPEVLNSLRETIFSYLSTRNSSSYFAAAGTGNIAA